MHDDDKEVSELFETICNDSNIDFQEEIDNKTVFADEWLMDDSIGKELSKEYDVDDDYWDR